MLLKDSQESPNKINWATIVKHILEDTGFGLVWYAQGVENTNMFMSMFKQRVSDCYRQEWMEKINMSTRANTYKLFYEFGFKTYLDSVEIKKFRIALTRLRVSSHRLEIETGRWHKPLSIPIGERKCKSCLVLEDELHFLLECQNYTLI